MNYDEIPGFRFCPTEEELVSFYLQQKLEGKRQEDLNRVIPTLYIYDYNPWELPQLAGERCRRDPQLEEWFFFIPRQEREARGGRPNRLTTTGYWKATGSPGWVYSSDEAPRIIGLKRTMVFYRGRARTRQSRAGSKTEWKMNEYIAIDPADPPPLSLAGVAMTQTVKFTVCRVYKKSKCLRAFDRRPAAPLPMARFGPITSSRHQAIDHDHHQLLASSDHHRNQPRSMVEKVASSSGESSSPSSGDHANNTTADVSLDGNDQENNIGMGIDQAPFWEFDSINWGF